MGCLRCVACVALVPVGLINISCVSTSSSLSACVSVPIFLSVFVSHSLETWHPAVAAAGGTNTVYRFQVDGGRPTSSRRVDVGLGPNLARQRAYPSRTTVHGRQVSLSDSFISFLCAVVQQ